jgi:hypothetical protein
MEQKQDKPQFVVCIKNEGYIASLELRKIYQVLPDAIADAHRLIRVIDESGEDYLYPEDDFAPITVPRTWIEALAVFGRHTKESEVVAVERMPWAYLGPSIVLPGLFTRTRRCRRSIRRRTRLAVLRTRPDHQCKIEIKRAR